MANNADSIKVKDNRLFNADGSLREPLPEEPAKTSPQAAAQKPVQTAPKTESKAAEKAPPSAHEEAYNSQAGTYPESIDFQTFMLSLASSAQISMGIVPNPMTGRASRDLDHAKQSIDILGMLEQKTQNNLTPEESGLLKNILFQLRMQFVELAKHEKNAS